MSLYGKYYSHICPNDDREEVWVEAGKACPNGCGWIGQPESTSE